MRKKYPRKIDYEVVCFVGEVVVGRHIQGRLDSYTSPRRQAPDSASFHRADTSVAAPNHRAGSGRELSGRRGVKLISLLDPIT